MEILSSYDFVFENPEGKKNPADGPSRRPDDENGYEHMTAKLLATLAATTITKSYDDLLRKIKAAQETDFLATEIRPTLVNVLTADESQRRSIDGDLTYERRIYVPTALPSRVTSHFHDNHESGHFGALNTAELVSRDLYWPAMESEIRKYVAGCVLCHRIKAPCHAHYALNMPLSPPSRHWKGLTRDLITDLPEAAASGHTGILVIVDHLTKMVINLPWRKDIDSPELAQMFFEHVICKQGVPDNITTDCGQELTSRFWDRVCSHLRINHRLSNALHPQTDGETERQNQMMELYLRASCNYEQDNWVKLLPLAEFAYNNYTHHSTLMTPFWANYNYHPTMQFKPPKDPRFISQVQADSWMAGVEEILRILQENKIEAQERQTKYAGRKEMTFVAGDKVWLLTRNLKTSRRSKKLDYKRTGLYTVSKIFNKNAYKVDLLSTMRNDKVFHVSLLNRYTPPVGGQPCSEPHRMIVEETEEWEVDCILNSRRCYWKLHYLVQWAGYNHIPTGWEPAEHLKNASDLVDGFHSECLDQPLE